MQSQTERRFRLTAGWDYERDEKWLDELSEKGLHMERPAFLRSIFKRENGTRYVYRIDHRPDLRDKQRFMDYINLYTDAGWEYKGTAGGVWHYFRQPWQADAVQELYTDRASLVQHYKRIQRMMTLAFVCNLPILVINTLNLSSRYSVWRRFSPILAFQVAAVLLLGYGVIRMGRRIKAVES